MVWELELIVTRGFLLYSGRTAVGLCAAVGRCLFFVLKHLGSGKEAVFFEANHVFIDAKGAYWIVNY